MHTSAACTVDSECCGYEAGLATCTKTEGSLPNAEGLCVEACTGESAENCPGCCAGHVATNVPLDHPLPPLVCGDGPDVAVTLEPFAGEGTVCERLCYLGVDEACPPGLSCGPTEVSQVPFVSVTVDYCKAPTDL
jgi:hypothetical protein